jgi:hypothetical protein
MKTSKIFINHDDWISINWILATYIDYKMWPECEVYHQKKSPSWDKYYKIISDLNKFDDIVISCFFINKEEFILSMK